MKKRIFSLVLFFFFINLNITNAGPRVGNGGGGWLCTNDNEVSWIQIIDLYEAAHEFDLEPLNFYGLELDQIFTLLMDKLDTIGELKNYNFQSYLYQARTKYILVEASDFFKIKDDLVRVRPSGITCPNGEISKVQIANMTFDGRLIINKKYWDYLSEKEKAALIFHEAYYKLFRDFYNDEDSTRARKVVGYLFSELSRDDLKNKFTESRENLFTAIDMAPLANILINTSFSDFVNRNLSNYCKEMNCPAKTEFIFESIINGQLQDKSTFKMQNFLFTYGIREIGKQCQFDVDYTALTGQNKNYISRVSFNCF